MLLKSSLQHCLQSSSDCLGKIWEEFGYKDYQVIIISTFSSIDKKDMDQMCKIYIQSPIVN